MSYHRIRALPHHSQTLSFILYITPHSQNELEVNSVSVSPKSYIIFTKYIFLAHSYVAMESEKLLSGRLSSDSSFDDIDIEHQIKPRRTRRSRLGKWALRLLVSWLTIWSTVNISTKVWKTFHKPERVSCACGSSLAEARALDCRFDPLASAWLRPQCIDEDLTAEFNRAGPEPDGSWNYYTDFQKSGTYTLEQVANLADTGIYYYNTQAWHLAHCTFNWRKSLRSRWTGVVMEARSDTEEHVKHCEAMMKTGQPLDYVGTVSAITFDADAAGLKEQMVSNTKSTILL
jgi:hypothetical protein